MNLGKVPEGGFQFLVTRQLGQFKARELTYRSQFITGPDAAEMGLATRCVADDELMNEVNALATRPPDSRRPRLRTPSGSST